MNEIKMSGLQLRSLLHYSAANTSQAFREGVLYELYRKASGKSKSRIQFNGKADQAAFNTRKKTSCDILKGKVNV